MSSARRCTLIALALLAGGATRVAAQPASPLAPGDRVRLLPPTSIEGTLVSLDSTTLSLRDTTGRTVQLVRINDMRLLVHVGPGPCSGARRGWCVLGGAVMGGTVGALGTLIATTNEFSSVPDSRVLYLGAPLGAAFGAAIGSIVGGDRWRRVHLPAAVSIAPSDAGVALRARLSF